MDNFWISHRREFAKMDKDIQRKQLKYHNKRVMVSKEFTFDAHTIYTVMKGNVKLTRSHI